MQGSTVEREASEKERVKVSPTLKDVDFINNGAAVYIDENDKIQLMSTLTADTEVRTQAFTFEVIHFRKNLNLICLSIFNHV